MTIYDAAMKYQDEGVPLLVMAGKEYGSGSSRDWAAKGTMLLGVKAVIAESFERIHRSNLVNMGVLPLQFQPAAAAVARAHRQGALRAHRHRAGSAAGRDHHRPRRRESGQGDRVSGGRAHRHAGRARRVPPRRNPAVRAAADVEAWQPARADAYLIEGGRAAGNEIKFIAGHPSNSLALPSSASIAMVTCDCRRHQGASAELGFDLCGIAPAAEHPELRFYREWLERGYAGEMATCTAPPTGAPTSAHVDARRAQTVIVTGTRLQHRPAVFDRMRRPRARADRPLRVGRRLSRCHRRAARCAGRVDARARRRSRSTRAPTSTPDRCRSASTRSTPASAGSARTPA